MSILVVGEGPLGLSFSHLLDTSCDRVGAALRHGRGMCPAGKAGNP
ncbi:hypothetical protein [Variovorax paradoxus]|nr:hypothetical protein [Variovorax paradoxus]